MVTLSGFNQTVGTGDAEAAAHPAAAWGLFV